MSFIERTRLVFVTLLNIAMKLKTVRWQRWTYNIYNRTKISCIKYTWFREEIIVSPLYVCLTQLSWLEDPSDGQAPISVMITTKAANTLKMHCRGGDRWPGIREGHLTLDICLAVAVARSRGWCAVKGRGTVTMMTRWVRASYDDHSSEGGAVCRTPAVRPEQLCSQVRGILGSRGRYNSTQEILNA